MAKKQDKRALNMLIEKAIPFTIEGIDGNDVTLYLHPLQLGRLAMISERLIDLDLILDGDGDNDVKKMWEICATKTKQVAEIIAIATLRTKEDVSEHLDERTSLLMHSPTMTPNAIANLFMEILFHSYFAAFMSAIRSVRTLQVQISQPTREERIAYMEEGVYGGK